MTELLFHARSEGDTERLGTALARHLPPGSVVALNGTLGAGKTRLVQAIAVALGVERAEVVSPTFVVVHEYHGTRPVYHFDAYRMKDDDEFLELGPDEYFESEGLSLVEWAERVERCLPRERLEIRIELQGETAREFRIIPRGAKYEAVVASLSQPGGGMIQ